MLQALARSMADTAHLALVSLASIRHIYPCDAPLRSGVEVLKAAYTALGLPAPEIPPDYLPNEPEEAPVSKVRTTVRPLPPVEEDEYCYVDAALEASRCRALLLEVIRRAVHDWVLYRQHNRQELKVLAHNAYVWLFEEEPGHADWEERQRSVFDVRNDREEMVPVKGARSLTSFLSICEAVGLSPEDVRERARSMTVDSIMHAGRPAERRKPSREDNVSIEEHSVLGDVDLNALDALGDSESAQYGYTSSYTPSYM